MVSVAFPSAGCTDGALIQQHCVGVVAGKARVRHRTHITGIAEIDGIVAIVLKATIGEVAGAVHIIGVNASGACIAEGAVVERGVALIHVNVFTHCVLEGAVLYQGRFGGAVHVQIILVAVFHDAMLQRGILT